MNNNTVAGNTIHNSYLFNQCRVISNVISAHIHHRAILNRGSGLMRYVCSTLSGSVLTGYLCFHPVTGQLDNIEPACNTLWHHSMITWLIYLLDSWYDWLVNS